jgi:hypothetical protein
MKSDAERCQEAEKLRNIDAAFRNVDLAALRASIGEPECVPNGPMPLSVGRCLQYATYHALPFIRTLLKIGADPNPTDHAGFPALIAALSCIHPRPESPGRPEERYHRHHQASSHVWRRPESTGH